VNSAAKNSNKSKKPGFERKNQLSFHILGFTLGPTAQATLVLMVCAFESPSWGAEGGGVARWWTYVFSYHQNQINLASIWRD
jgi:hypothetical protein